MVSPSYLNERTGLVLPGESGQTCERSGVPVKARPARADIRATAEPQELEELCPKRS